MTRVEAPSRLHFGLLSVPVAGQTHWPDPDGKPGLPIRSFGGVGLMIDRPGVVVEATPSPEWSADGIHAERALDFARTFVGSLPVNEQRCFQVRVECCPPEHIGLGVGTALGLSVARALAIELGHADWDAVELAKRVGRGRRSAVGVHGFQHGGLIVEAGKLPHEEIAPLVGRFEFPEEWRIVLLCPRTVSDWHGLKERAAFASAVHANDTAVLCQIVLTGILPAMASRDYVRFAEAIHEFNARAGKAFLNAQEGVYSSAEVKHLVSLLREQGVASGQTSWGPTTFAIVRNAEVAQELSSGIQSACDFLTIEACASKSGANTSNHGAFGGHQIIRE